MKEQCSTPLGEALAECRKFKLEHRANTKAYDGFSRLEYLLTALPSENTLINAAPERELQSGAAGSKDSRATAGTAAQVAAPSDDKQRAEAERIAWDTIKEYGCHLPERNDVKLAKAFLATLHPVVPSAVAASLDVDLGPYDAISSLKGARYKLIVPGDQPFMAKVIAEVPDLEMARKIIAALRAPRSATPTLRLMTQCSRHQGVPITIRSTLQTAVFYCPQCEEESAATDSRTPTDG